jgi:endonuclease YncB( thermonuclease family)
MQPSHRTGYPPRAAGRDDLGRRLLRLLRPSTLRLIAVLIIGALALFDLLPPGEIRGPAEVVDGDSLLVSGDRVRLYAIDAPELDQPCRTGGPCGQRARAHLAEIVAGRILLCEKRDTDRYGRDVAQCYIVEERSDGKTARGEDIGRAMVRDGQAMAYRRIAETYVADEPARVDFEPPWEWRERHQAR